ncbi:MAG TPA: CBS domain-containing protein [Gemmataceae bacterium]|jgi:CBS-domain-containing membrane protein|nr:CBS domain-containing protein [Gemmataceae bacterium]
MTATEPKTRFLTLKATTAVDLMTEHVVSIPEDAPLHEAIAVLTDRGFSGAPVINVAGRPVGVISQSDILVHDRNSATFARPVPEYYTRSDLRSAIGEDVGGFQVETVERTMVGDVMTPVVFSIRPDAPARQVIEELLHLRVHRLFVIDRDGVLIGVICMSDILRRLLD